MFSYLVLCLTLHVCLFSSVAGQEDCWLLTETLMQTATLQLKVCLNVQCLALHSFTDLHPGKWKLLKKATSFIHADSLHFNISVLFSEDLLDIFLLAFTDFLINQKRALMI